jgi:hypothetical protein
MRNAQNILGGNPEGKGSLRRPMHRWEDNIRIHKFFFGLHFSFNLKI